MAENGSKKALIASAVGFAVVLALAGYLIKTKVLGAITFHTSDAASAREAAEHDTLRVVLIENPAEKACIKFRKNVLGDSRVKDLAEELVWQQDNASKGERNVADRSNNYVGVPMGTGKLPHLLIFNPKGQVVTGLIGAENMTPDQFLALIADARKDPRPATERAEDEDEE